MKILLVRLRLIGDTVFTTPLVGALRRRYPQATLCYAVEPTAAPVIRDNRHLDEVIVVPKPTGLARWRQDLATARHLRRRRFDVAIDLHGGPRSAWFTLSSRAPMRIGYRSPGRTWIYTHVVPRPDGLRPRHSVANQWDLLAPLGISPSDPDRDPVEMSADADAAARVARRLTQAGITEAHQLIVVHVSAGNPFRRWPPDSFATLVADLARRDPTRRFMIVSGPSETDAARAVAEQAARRLGSDWPAVAAGEFDVGELRALVDRAAAYVGGDSGPLHVAATTETPIVALFGPTLPERSMPWRDRRWFAEAVDAGPLPCRPCHQRTCEPGDFRCLTGVTADRVAAAVERAVAGARTAAGVDARPPRALRA